MTKENALKIMKGLAAWADSCLYYETLHDDPFITIRIHDGDLSAYDLDNTTLSEIFEDIKKVLN